MKGSSKIMNAELDREVKITKTSPDGRPAEYEFPNGTKIAIEFVSTIYEPKSEDDEEQCTYCKVIKLEHSGENNGTLLATRETVGGGDDFYPIYESRDDGRSWKEIAVVRDDFNESGKAGWQPCLYELPTDIGDFKEGTVILGGCSRNAGRGISKSMMTLYKSVDCGKHWEGFATISKWGGIGNGIWEPYIIYEEKSGRLYCFYSEDFPPEHSQQLVYKYTTDMVNWSEKRLCVSCDDPNLRPGMISIAKLGNGKYYMAFEMVGFDGIPIYYKETDDLDKWDIPSYGTPIVSNEGKTFGTAPAVSWTPLGGEQGTMFVTGQHMVKGTSASGTDMFVSFDCGRTFYNIDNPIGYVLKNRVRCGYSSGMFADKDGALYYSNDTNYGENNEKMMFAKITVK